MSCVVSSVHQRKAGRCPLGVFCMHFKGLQPSTFFVQFARYKAKYTRTSAGLKHTAVQYAARPE